MLSILINFVFKIITKIADFIMAPLISLVSALIPSFSTFLSYIYKFIDYCFEYFLFFVKLLCIPQECMLALYTVAVATLTITISIQTYKLVITIYNKFKP